MAKTKKFAKVSGAVIVQVIVAESKESADSILKAESVELERNAGVGWFYDETIGDYVPPKFYPSWVFDPELWMWVAPEAKPETEPEAEWREGFGKWLTEDEATASLEALLAEQEGKPIA